MNGTVYYEKKRKRFSYFDVLKDIFPCRGDGIKDVFRKLAFLSTIIVLGVCSFFIYDYFWSSHKTNQLYDDAKNLYHSMNDETSVAQTTVSEEAEEEHWEFLSGARALWELNPETVGYISIPDTPIDYPVLQRRDPETGNTFYLDRDFNLDYSRAGAIFLDWRNSFDYVLGGKLVEPNSDNLIIYGHDMKKNEMFGSLKLYDTDHSYYGKHPLINLNSNYKTYTYKIFGLFLSDGSSDEFPYFNYINFNSSEEFYEYVNGVKIRSKILNDVDVKYGDKLLTLSTCSSIFSDARLVVVARLVREGEDPYEGTQNNSRNPNPLMPKEYYRWNNERFDSDAEFIPYG